MANPLDGLDADKLRQKTWPWWHANVGERLTSEGRTLLEACGVPPASVDDHVHKVRDQAWEVFPFPCVGEFWFLEFGISQHPRFHDVISRLKQNFAQSSPANPKVSTSESNDPISTIIQNPHLPRLLDLGTCVGQDVRVLRHYGAPAPTLYGSDVFAGFEAAGHELFLDKKSFAGHFLVADVFDDTPQSPLNVTTGLWDIVTATMFTHQFDLEHQKLIARRMVRLLRSSKGSMIVGTSTGQLEAKDVPLRPPFCEKPGDKMVYRQNKETMHDLWTQAIAEHGGGVDGWSVTCGYDEKETAKREQERKEKGEVRYFQGDGQRRIFFCVERLQ